MSEEHLELDELQSNYKAAVEAWIAAIRRGEALASVNHSVAEVDKWEPRMMVRSDLEDSCDPPQGRAMICVGDTPWTRRTQRVKWL